MKRLIIFKIRQTSEKEVVIEGHDIVALTKGEEEMFREVLDAEGFKLLPRE